MTKRELFEAIVNGEVITDEMREVANAAIVAMDTANEKRKSKPSKASVENAPIVERIVTEVLGSEGKTASEVAAAVEISVQKASALLRSIVADGRAVSEEVKLPKKGNVKVYTLAD